MNKRPHPYYLAGIISVLTLLIYLPSLSNDFVVWDDEYNVYNNIHIRLFDMGFVKWAFTDISLSYWQPMTWISYAADYALWGLNPFGYHLTNIILHASVTFIIVILTARLVEAGKGPSEVLLHSEDRVAMDTDSQFTLIAAAVTGSLFGLHPLHVESTAWVSGRTDLLCSVFFLAGILSYMSYVSYKTYKAYFLTLFIFMLALASKPTAVVLPAALLLLDWYPLQRISSWSSFRAVCIEKFPFAAVGLVLSTAVFWGEKVHGRMAPSGISFAARSMVALKALTIYLQQIVFPLNLLPFHPYPETITPLSLEYLGYATLVAAVTTACLLALKKRKIFFAAWLCFLIPLLPVVDIVAVREVYMADRYMYLPALGPFLLIGTGAARLWIRAERMQQMRNAVKIGGVIVVCLFIAFSYLTVKQIAIWKNGVTLWNAVIANASSPGPTAYINRGLAFKAAGKPDLAFDDINTAITLSAARFQAPMAYTYRGILYKDKGRLDLAIEDYTRAVSINPGYADAYANRGIAFNATGQFDRAIADFDRAISLDPGQYQSYIGRGTAYKETGRQGKAIEDYTAAISLNPGNADAYIYRGIAYKEIGQFPRALEDYGTAIRLNPASVEAYNDRGVAHKHMGQLDMAVADYDRALALNQAFAPAYMNRGAVLAVTGRGEDAARDFQKACDLGTEAGCDALRGHMKR